MALRPLPDTECDHSPPYDRRRTREHLAATHPHSRAPQYIKRRERPSIALWATQSAAGSPPAAGVHRPPVETVDTHSPSPTSSKCALQSLWTVPDERTPLACHSRPPPIVLLAPKPRCGSKYPACPWPSLGAPSAQTPLQSHKHDPDHRRRNAFPHFQQKSTSMRSPCSSVLHVFHSCGYACGYAGLLPANPRSCDLGMSPAHGPISTESTALSVHQVECPLWKNHPRLGTMAPGFRHAHSHSVCEATVDP